MMGRFQALVLGGMLAASVAAAPARAAVINFAEGADFSTTSGSPTAVGALGIGTNVITGSISCASGCSAGDFADYFNVTLAAGLRITSIALSIRNFAQSNGAIGIIDTSGPAVFANTNINNGFASPTTLFSGTADGPGTQGFHLGITGGGSASRALSFGYELDIVVGEGPTNTGGGSAGPTVPEPATLVLLGTGFLSLGLARRRRRR